MERRRGDLKNIRNTLPIIVTNYYLQVKFYVEKEFEEFSVEISETSTLNDLRYLLLQKTSVQRENQLLFKIDQSRMFAYKPIHETKTLFDLGVTDNANMSLEIKGSGQISFFLFVTLLPLIIFSQCCD